MLTRKLEPHLYLDADPATDEAAKRLAWETGDLSWTLFDYQLPLYDKMRSVMDDMRRPFYAASCARRFGKTTAAMTALFEVAIQNPGSLLRVVSSTSKAVRKRIKPIVRKMLLTCPKEMRPKWDSMEQCYRFANESEIHMSGVEREQFENLRGEDAQVIYLDEAGFIDDLEYIYRSILLPQLMSSSGTLIATSTPPKHSDHYWRVMWERARAENSYSEFTVYDNKRLTEETIEIWCRETGGAESTDWKREYLCEWVTDKVSAVVPEWLDLGSLGERGERLHPLVGEAERPPYFYWVHRYNSMDMGTKDLTVALFAWWDFPNSRLVVEDEQVMTGPEMTTSAMAQLIQDRNEHLWDDMPVFRQVMDCNNPQMTIDLNAFEHTAHKFFGTKKNSLEAMVNRMRMFVKSEKLLVHPRCTQLIGCLENALWDSNRREWKRGSDLFGHYDALAALMYLILNIDERTNPVPDFWGIDRQNNVLPFRRGQNESSNRLMVRTIMGGRR